MMFSLYRAHPMKICRQPLTYKVDEAKRVVPDLECFRTRVQLSPPPPFLVRSAQDGLSCPRIELLRII